MEKTMKLEMQSKGVELTGKLRNHIETRIRFALSRFGDRIRHVHVRLTDINGPRGGEDVRVKIQAQCWPRGEVVLQELHQDPFAAVAIASDRVSHSLSRKLDRLRTQRRRRA